MRILVLAPELFRADGGIARILRAYLKALCAVSGPDGEVRSVVLNDAPGVDRRLSLYSDQHLRSHLGCGGKKLRYVTQAIRLARQADLLVCGHLHHLAIARLAQRLHPRLRYVLVAHGLEAWRPYSALERSALRHAARVLCVSEYTRRQLRRFLPELDPARLLVVANTLDPFFAINADAERLRGLFVAPNLLTVSRLTAADRYKGIDTLIEALPAILSTYPRARLRVVGEGDDRPRLAALVQSLGIGRAVEFTGAITDESLRAEYQSCDVFALPSQREGFGLVYVEAMAHGKPCLAACAGGAPEVVTEDVGALVPFSDSAAIARAVDDLVRHPRDSEVVRRHAATFAFPVFQSRLAAALS